MEANDHEHGEFCEQCMPSDQEEPPMIITCEGGITLPPLGARA